MSGYATGENGSDHQQWLSIPSQGNLVSTSCSRTDANGNNLV